MSTEQIRRAGRWGCRRVGEKSEAVFARVSFPFPSWKTEHVLPIPRGVISAGAPAETIYAGSECNKNTDFHGIWRQSRQKPNFSLDSGRDIDFLLIALGQNVQMYWLRLLKASGSFQTAAVVCFDQGPTHARVLFVSFFKIPTMQIIIWRLPKITSLLHLWRQLKWNVSRKGREEWAQNGTVKTTNIRNYKETVALKGPGTRGCFNMYDTG